MAEWTLDGKIIVNASLIEVPPGSKLEVVFIPDKEYQVIPSYYQIFIQAQNTVGLWTCQLIHATDTKVYTLAELESAGITGTKNIKNIATGSIKQLKMICVNQNDYTVKLKYIELHPSTQLDDATASAVEALMPAVLVVQNESNIVGNASVETYSFNVPTTRATTLIAHILLTVYLSAPAAVEVKLNYDGLERDLPRMLLQSNTGYNTHCLTVPLQNIPSGGCSLRVDISSSVGFNIPIGHLLVAIDGKNLSVGGSGNPRGFINDLIETTPYLGKMSIYMDNSTQITKTTPIKLNIKDKMEI